MKTKNIIIAGLICLAFAGTITAQEKIPPVKNAPAQNEQQQDSVYYTCTMHKDITAEKPGTCSKCGMPMEKKSAARSRPRDPKMEGVKTYSCVTHPDVRSDKPGKCTRCGMDLVIDEKVK